MKLLRVPSLCISEKGTDLFFLNGGVWYAAQRNRGTLKPTCQIKNTPGQRRPLE
jgi:hypothetical protein